MSKFILTCWKCGNKYEVDFLSSNSKCPNCGALYEDEKESVRTGKAIGTGMMVIGIIVAFLALFIPAEPNGTFLVLGFLIAVIGFLVKGFAKPIW